MEIALNMLQPMGTETMPAVAGTAAVPVSQASDGAFALFFAQLLETMPVPTTELRQQIPEQVMTAAQKEEMPVQETELTEKELSLPTELAVELQAASLMPLTPQPVPVTPVPTQPEREAGTVPVPVETVSINVVPEAEPTVTAAPPTPAPQVPATEGAFADRPQPLTSAEMPPAQPAAEKTAPVKEEQHPVKIAAAIPQNEVRLTTKDSAPAPPVREAEAVPTVPQAPALTPVPAAEDVVEPQKVVIKTGTVEETVSASQRTPGPAAEAVPDQETGGETTAEKAVTTEAKPVTVVAKDADFSGSNGEEPQEQRLAPQGKEILPHPAAPATESLREPEPVRQAQASSTTIAPAAEHENIMLQVKEKLSVHSVRPGNDQISFTLHPEELGELKIMMRVDDQRLKVEIITQNNTVREALMQNLEGLKETLSRQSITVDRFDVSTGGGSFNQAFYEGRHAGRDRIFQPYPQFAGSMKEPEQKTIVTGWLPREDSLVDVRF